MNTIIYTYILISYTCRKEIIILLINIYIVHILLYTTSTDQIIKYENIEVLLHEFTDNYGAFRTRDFIHYLTTFVPPHNITRIIYIPI